MNNRFETFTTDIASIYKNIQKIKKYEMNKIGLKGTHVTCMNLLNNSTDGLTATEICSLAKEDKAGISRALSELFEIGFVKYLTDEEANDKRKYRAKVTLTDKGTASAVKMNEAIINAVNYAGSDISDENRIILYSALSSISNNLDEYCCKLEKELKNE